MSGGAGAVVSRCWGRQDPQELRQQRVGTSIGARAALGVATAGWRQAPVGYFCTRAHSVSAVSDVLRLESQLLHGARAAWGCLLVLQVDAELGVWVAAVEFHFDGLVGTQPFGSALGLRRGFERTLRG